MESVTESDRHTKDRLKTMMKKALAGVLAAAVMLVVPAAATARPSTDFNSGAAEHSDCRVTKTNDRGYLIEVKEVDRDGDVRWVKQRVKKLPSPDSGIQFRVVRDLGVNVYKVCDY